MGFAEAYLQKQQYLKYIPGAPSGLLRYIIIIPCYCESGIISTLESLVAQKSTKFSTEVLIHVNYSEDDSQENKYQNKEQFKKLNKWAKVHSLENIKFHPFISEDIPAKHAGAGFARKIAMDAAIERFNKINNPEGFILSLDADTHVPEDYLLKVEESLLSIKNVNTIIFNFEHELSGTEFDEKIYKAITLYELHLRYYRRMLLKIGFPYPFFTIGSCFGIKAELYTKVGGMNRRKAGEDFYFLQKVFPFNHVVFLKDTVLKPSPRPSWRVPFGTGPAVRKIVESDELQLQTYSIEAFLSLKKFIMQLPSLYNIPEKEVNGFLDSLDSVLKQFLIKNNFISKLDEIKKNASNRNSFIKRFYSWFDAFMVIKYLNYSKNNNFVMVTIENAVLDYLKRTDVISDKEMLLTLRYLDKTEN